MRISRVTGRRIVGHKPDSGILNCKQILKAIPSRVSPKEQRRNNRGGESMKSLGRLMTAWKERDDAG